MPLVIFSVSSAVTFGWKWFHSGIKWYLIHSRCHSHSAAVWLIALCSSAGVVSFFLFSTWVFICFVSKEISTWHFECQISTRHLTWWADVMISGDVIKWKAAAGVNCESVLSFKWLIHLRDLVARSSAEPHMVLHRLSLPHRRSN